VGIRIAAKHCTAEKVGTVLWNRIALALNIPFPADENGGAAQGILGIAPNESDH
jgi:hypothetical protein